MKDQVYGGRGGVGGAVFQGHIKEGSAVLKSSNGEKRSIVYVKVYCASPCFMLGIWIANTYEVNSVQRGITLMVIK